MHPQRTDEIGPKASEERFCKALETPVGMRRICALWTATCDTNVTIGDTMYYMTNGNMNDTSPVNASDSFVQGYTYDLDGQVNIG